MKSLILAHDARVRIPEDTVEYHLIGSVPEVQVAVESLVARAWAWSISAARR